MIARRADAEYSAFVSTVISVGPKLTRDAAHRHGDYVAALVNGVIHRLGERVDADEDDVFRDAQRQDFCVGSAAQGTAAEGRNHSAGENRQSGGTVAAVIEGRAGATGVDGELLGRVHREIT